MESGTRLGPYEILEQLGAGGMGEVWLAEDTRLHRKVAIKVLPEEYAGDPERLARFEQEARAAAALNHPHIAVVHDIGTEADTHFMVQEYLRGQSLREALEKGALPLDKTLDLATEVSEALAAAHKAGIVHRDLKPDNIFVTEQGHAKVLDFGLAKLMEMSPMSGSASMSPTMLGTVAGQVMGTAGYMAPEQVSGEEVDQRADLFAFGCVLYAMATGRQAFSGKNVHETLAHILSDEPVPVVQIDGSLPAELQRIVRKTLAKDVTRRYQTAGDLGADLRQLQDDIAAGVAMPVVGRSVDAPAAVETVGGFPWKLVAPIAVAALLISVAGTWGWLRPAEGVRAVQRFDVALAEEAGEVTLFDDSGRSVVIAPDASRIVWVGSGPSGVMLYVRDLDGFSPRPIPGTGGADMPFFSPDSRTVGFFVGNVLKTVGFGGGLPTEIGHVGGNARGATWREDGTIVIGNSSDIVDDLIEDSSFGLQIISGDSREVRDFLPGDEKTTYRYPQFLPGGDRILFTIENVESGARSGKALAVYSLSTREIKTLSQSGTHARYVSTGHLLFARGTQLVAVPFDIRTLQATGDEKVIVESLHVEPNVGYAHFDVADDGTLVYAEARPTIGRLSWVSDDGTTETIVDDPGGYRTPRISPDGTRAALWIFTSEDERIGILDLRDGSQQPLTEGPEEFAPEWMPEGDTVVFGGQGGAGRFQTFRIANATSFTGIRELINVGPIRYSYDHIAVHPDGTALALTGYDGARSIWVVKDSEGTAGPFAVTGASEWAPAFSPDGRWLAFVSDEQGRPQVYVRSYPDADRKLAISLDGGTEPAWSSAGELFFLQGDTMMKSMFDPETRTRGRPVALFKTFAIPGAFSSTNYDIADDGRFLMVLADEFPFTTKLRVVLNWFEELKQRVPTGR